MLLGPESGVGVAQETEHQTTTPSPFDSQPATEERQPATAKFWASPQQVVAGETTYIAVEFSIEEHWHIYWLYAGANGDPTEFNVMAPENIEVGPVIFPRPQRFKEPEGDVYGYENKAVFLVPLTVHKNHRARKISVSIDAYWLVCRKICLLGEKSQKIMVEVLPPDATVQPPDAQVKAALAAKPIDAITVKGFEIFFGGGLLKLSGPLKGLDKADFFPNPMAGIQYGTPKITTSGSRFEIDVPVEIELHNTLGEKLDLRGLVVLGDKPTDPSYSFSVPAKAQTPPDKK